MSQPYYINKYGEKYKVVDCGVNRQGNHWCTRDYGTGSHSNGLGRGDAYHYSNADGSYYYKNSNGSTYYNDGNGKAVYTPPNGSPVKMKTEVKQEWK